MHQIDSYSFGSMTINGHLYQKDLIIFPDFIKPDWWRREGHVLLVEDLKEVIDYKPDILIVGTGASGMMDIPSITRETLSNNNIELIDENTHQAYKIFNEYVKNDKKKLVGAFHLTC